MTDPEPEFLTVAEFAAVTRADRWTVYREIRAGRLPAIRVGRALRIHRSALAPKEAA